LATSSTTGSGVKKGEAEREKRTKDRYKNVEEKKRKKKKKKTSGQGIAGTGKKRDKIPQN